MLLATSFQPTSQILSGANTFILSYRQNWIFGVEESTEIEIAEFVENFEIFLDHDSEWEEANELILENRDNSIQRSFPAMEDLEKAVYNEIDWQKAMWEFDFEKAVDAGREALSNLGHTELRGYRALWHYLTGSAAHLGVGDGNPALEKQARLQFSRARTASYGISWMSSLSSVSELHSNEDEDDNGTIVKQVERLESYIASLETIHNRKFTAREMEIRNGLRHDNTFEAAHAQLGSHLGFETGKEESEAAPDAWWRIGDVTIVFEDHANAKPNTAISSRKARQVNSHPNWVEDNLPQIPGGTILPVLITPATKANKGAMPHLKQVYYWKLEEFLNWSDDALDTVRKIRRSFVEPGDLDWRAIATEALEEIKADAKGLSSWLSSPASQ